MNLKIKILFIIVVLLLSGCGGHSKLKKSEIERDLKNSKTISHWIDLMPLSLYVEKLEFKIIKQYIEENEAVVEILIENSIVKSKSAFFNDIASAKGKIKMVYNWRADGWSLQSISNKLDAKI